MGRVSQLGVDYELNLFMRCIVCFSRFDCAKCRESLIAGSVEPTRVKLCVIGNAAAGKTTLINLFKTNRKGFDCVSFSPCEVKPSAHKPTEKVTLDTVSLEGIDWLVQDFPGQVSVLCCVVCRVGVVGVVSDVCC